MRLETHASRREQKLRTAMNLTATHERVREAQKIAQAQEDGFMLMCELNHREALERDAKQDVAHAQLWAEKLKRETAPKVDRTLTDFLNGLCVGGGGMLLIVWLLLLAAGVI